MVGPQRPNRLIHTSSPYLLQHAHHPVDWYPWSEEALARARREDQPILLSIGYAACHWCHVMAHESFEDEATARLMNEHFVCIKVDREERPDLDELYMSAVVALTGSGGWPLNVFLTPDLQPFWGGTYFPPEERWGHPGWRSVLRAVSYAYAEKRAQIEEAATQLVAALAREPRVAPGPGLDGEALLAAAVSDLKASFDPVHGGFGGVPKFPRCSALELLLRHAHRAGDPDALAMVTLTLDRMARGGIHDQLGGGFHRYSVDAEWLVPHFEKMLYDNAQLAALYLQAYRLTGRPRYAGIARETLDYVLREMADRRGGFHSTQDADSEGEEGRYYVWEPGEVRRVLGPEEAELFCSYYGVTPDGNFEGRSILHVPTAPEAFAAERGLSPEELDAQLVGPRRRLLAIRAERVPPAKDDKVLADWNGLMISALARGYEVLGAPCYREAATRAAQFVLDEMGEAGELRHAYRAGCRLGQAFLDDYAFVLQALLDLYEATLEPQWVQRARRVAAGLLQRFWDRERAGFYLTSAGQPDLVVRRRRGHDDATPSGWAAAAHALLRLGHLTRDAEHTEHGERALQALVAEAQSAPYGYAAALGALAFHLGPVTEVVVSGPPAHPETRRLWQAVQRRFLPNRVLAGLDPDAPGAAAATEAIPPLAAKPAVGGAPTAYVCDEQGCRPPVTTAADLAELLRAGRTEG